MSVTRPRLLVDQLHGIVSDVSLKRSICGLWSIQDPKHVPHVDQISQACPNSLSNLCWDKFRTS